MESQTCGKCGAKICLEIGYVQFVAACGTVVHCENCFKNTCFESTILMLEKVRDNLENRIKESDEDPLKRMLETLNDEICPGVELLKMLKTMLKE